MSDQESNEISTKDIPIVHQKSGEPLTTLVELDLPSGRESTLIRDVLANLGDETEEAQESRGELARYYNFQSSVLLDAAAREMGNNFAAYEAMRDRVVGAIDGEGYEDSLRCRDNQGHPQPIEFTDEDKVVAFKNGLKRELNERFAGIKNARDGHLMLVCAENFMDTVLQSSGVVPFASESVMQHMIRRGTSETSASTQEEQPIRL